MQEFIARENIRRFEKQLADCDDPAQRQVLLQLLETERRRLADAEMSKPRQARGQN